MSGGLDSEDRLQESCVRTEARKGLIPADRGLTPRRSARLAWRWSLRSGLSTSRDRRRTRNDRPAGVARAVRRERAGATPRDAGDGRPPRHGGVQRCGQRLLDVGPEARLDRHGRLRGVEGGGARALGGSAQGARRRCGPRQPGGAGLVRNTDQFGDRSDPLTRRLGNRADEVGLAPEQVAASVVHVLASPPGVVHPEVAILSVKQ